MIKTRSLIIILVFLLVPVFSFAADLSLSPSVYSPTVGKAFSVSVNVSSLDKAINAVSGTIQFPKDKIQVVSVSKDNSIISLWVQEPSFSNTNGSINLEGVAFNPGFKGELGKLITISFKPISAGVAEVSLINGSVLANDGTGTNILSKMNNAVYNIAKAPQPVEKPASISQPIEVVTPVSSTTEPVKYFIRVDSYLREVDFGNSIRIAGTASPNKRIFIKIFNNSGQVSEEVTSSEQNGDWEKIITKKLDPDMYSFVASIDDDNGVKLDQTESKMFVVKQHIFSKIIDIALEYLSAIIILLIALFAVFIVLSFCWYRLIALLRRTRNKAKNAEKILEKSFTILQNDINEHIKSLKQAKKNRALTPEEIAFLGRFKEELGEAKDIINREIGSIINKK
jgi:hypothetical protein